MKQELPCWLNCEGGSDSIFASILPRSPSWLPIIFFAIVLTTIGAKGTVVVSFFDAVGAKIISHSEPDVVT